MHLPSVFRVMDIVVVVGGVCAFTRRRRLGHKLRFRPGMASRSGGKRKHRGGVGTRRYVEADQ